jgi:transposase-like protein
MFRSPGFPQHSPISKNGFGNIRFIDYFKAEVLISQGIPIAEAGRKIGVTEQTYYRWRREYSGMKVEQARRLKELEKENTRLKRLVVDLPLDNAILKEATRGNS